MRVLHVAPFDPSRYPPLIQTTKVCAAAGADSDVIAATPVRAPLTLTGTQLVQPSTHLSRVDLLRYLITGIRRAMRVNRPDLVIAHNYHGLLAAAVGAAATVPLVYHCHDFVGAPNLRGRLDLLLEQVSSFRVDEVWVPARERTEEVFRRGLRGQVRLVRNCPRRLATLPRGGRLRGWLGERGCDTRTRIVARHGSIGRAHCILESIEALAWVAAPTTLVVIGEGDEDYVRACEARARQLGLERRVWFHPFVPHDQLYELLVDVDVSLGLYAPTEFNTASPAPNKVFESLAAGVGVIVTAGNSLAEEVVSANVGLAVDHRSPRGIGDAIERLIDGSSFAEQVKANAREAHLRELNYEHQLAPTVLGRLLGLS